MIRASDFPPAVPLARRHHRRFVVRRRKADEAAQTQTGLDSFAEDWARLMATPAPRARVPRRVFLLWLQGEAAAPDLVRRCLESWRAGNPGWRVTVLDADSLSDWIAPPDVPPGTSPNHVSNLIRLRLLERHGGVWADATSLCLRPLDDWIDRAAAAGFFAFARPQPRRPLANWFLAAQPRHLPVAAWRKWSDLYIGDGRPADAYFWSHYTFDWLVRCNPWVRRDWARVPRVSARGPHVAQRLLDGHLSEIELPAPAAMAELPLVKLNRKKGYTVEAVERTLATYGVSPPRSSR